MRTTYIILFLTFCSYCQGQLSEHFEFLDQDYRSSIITSAISSDEQIVFTSFSYSGDDSTGTRITLIDNNGDPVSKFITSFTHDLARIYIMENGNTIVHFLSLFDCDYAPRHSILTTISKTKIETIDLNTEQLDFIQVDACLIYENNIPQIKVLAKDLDLVTLFSFDLDGNLISQDLLSDYAKRIFSYNNKLYYINGNDELIDLDSGEILLSDHGEILNIKQQENKLLIMADQILVFDFETQEIIKLMDYDNDIVYAPQFTYGIPIGVSLSLVDDELIFIGNDENDHFKFYTADFTNLIVHEKYDEPYPGLNPRFIHYDGNDFLTTYQTNKTGHIVLRKTPDLINYNFERIDIKLNEPLFHSEFIDTFYINSVGDTSHYSAKFMKGTVNIENLDTAKILSTVLNSHKTYIHGWDCGYLYATDRLQLNLLPTQSYTHTGLHSYDPFNLDSTYFYCPGANYKLDKDPSDNFVSSSFSTHNKNFKNTSSKLFPNPASDEVQIELDQKMEGLFEIYNLEGILVQKNEYNAKMVKLDIRSLPPGLYFLRISTTTDLQVIPVIKQ